MWVIIMAKRIFVADDDQGILEALRVMLEDEGYEVFTHGSGVIIEEIKANIPDLVLLDIWMSGQDGRQVAEALRSDEVTRTIPIIMISAHKETDKIAQSVGADDFIYKPFDIDEFLNKIQRFV